MVLSCYENTLSPTWNTLYNNTNSSGFLHIHTRKVLLPHGIIGLCSHSGLCRLRWIHWVLHDIHVITTEIRPGFYIYTLERSFCLMINIMIDIRYISRCAIQISSQSGLYYMRLRHTISLAPYMSRIYHQLPPKKTRGPDVASSVSRLIFMRLSWQRTMTPFRVAQHAALTLLLGRELYIYTKCHIYIYIQWILPKPAADLFCKYRYSVQIGAVYKARIPPLWYNSKQFSIYRILSTVETGRISWSQRYIWHCPNRIYWFFIDVFQPPADWPMFTCRLMPSHLVTSIAIMSVHARGTHRWL